MADSTLAAIQKKVRRLTRSPSTAQISDADLNEYINTFILYDFPEHLRLFTLRQEFKFYTTPNVDVYSTNDIDLDSPLFNFKNKVISVHEPVYVAGFKVLFSQSRDEFFKIYPFVNTIENIGTGDGINTFFSGTLQAKPVLQNKVIFTSFDTNNEGLVLKDVPQLDPATGVPLVIGNLVVPDSSTSVGTINYKTGDYSFNFPAAPAANAKVEAQTFPYVASRPESILYFDNSFTVRPVPDKPYEVSMEVYVRPTELMATTDIPELEQWWQYIAYGAAKKIFEDRMDTESITKILPEFKQQERLALRRTISQQTNERVATIYTEQSDFDYYNGGWRGGPF